MKKSLYIFSNGTIKRKQNTIYFLSENDEKKYIPVENTKEIYVFGEVTINKKLLEFFTQKEILLHFFNYHGYYVGTYYPREHYNSGLVILKQAEYYLDEEKRMTLARAFVEGAATNILRVLKYHERKGIDLKDIIQEIEVLKSLIDRQTKVEELMAIEGNIRDTYYSAFDKILEDSDFSFNKRTRRPPKNRLNALISFGNQLLYVAVLSEIYRTHLDPRIGYLHSTNQRRFTLNLDVAEIFKPIIVDRMIISLIKRKMLKKEHFDARLKGILLKDSGKKIFLKEWDSRMQSTVEHKKLKRQVSYQRLLRLELYKLEKHFIEGKEYKPYVMKY